MDQTARFSMKSLPILLSVSAFSVLFSFSFLPITDFNQIRSYITDRNYIFLFCNGILVLIIKSSSFATDSSMYSDNKHGLVEKSLDQVQPVAELAENKTSYKEEVITESEEMQVKVCECLGKEDKEIEYEYDCEEEDDELGLLSTEELNKKCDDFIRKMREGINSRA